MATRYIWSGGSNTSPYDTWAKAATTTGNAVTGSSAGDSFYFAQDHTENVSVSTTYAFPGTIGSPNLLLCVDRTSGLLTTGAQITQSGAFGISFLGYFYGYGIKILLTNGNSSCVCYICGGSNYYIQQLENWTIDGSSTSGPAIWAGIGYASRTIFKNCTLKTTAWGVVRFENEVYVIGGVIAQASQNNQGCIYVGQSSRGGKIELQGVDLSGLPSAANLFLMGNNFNQTGLRAVARNCKLPASWSGKLIGGTPNSTTRAEMWDCDDGATNYRMQIEDMVAGSIVQDTAHYLNASDGTTPFSRKMTSLSGANSYITPLWGPDTSFWNEDTGSAKTLTVEIAQEGGSNLNDNDVWLEVEYLGDSGSPKASRASTMPDALASGSALTTSNAAWNGFSSPTKQKLSVAITPQMKGQIIWRLVLGKASTTLYYDTKASFV